VRVGDRGGFQGGLGESRRRRGLVPEAGIGEEAGAALRVVDDRDLEQPVVRQLPAEQLLGEERQVGDVVDDGLGDASPALRMTGASPSWSPRMIAGSTRWSRQVTTIICAVGGPRGTGV